jgi:hypothetical protein
MLFRSKTPLAVAAKAVASELGHDPWVARLVAAVLRTTD